MNDLQHSDYDDLIMRLCLRMVGSVALAMHNSVSNRMVDRGNDE